MSEYLLREAIAGMERRLGHTSELYVECKAENARLRAEVEESQDNLRGWMKQANDFATELKRLTPKPVGHVFKYAYCSDGSIVRSSDAGSLAQRFSLTFRDGVLVGAEVIK